MHEWQENKEPHQFSSNLIKSRPSSSIFINYHQILSIIVGYHQTSLEPIRPHQTPSDPIRPHQTPSGLIRPHRRRAAKCLQSVVNRFPQLDLRFQGFSLCSPALTLHGDLWKPASCWGREEVGETGNACNKPLIKSHLG